MHFLDVLWKPLWPQHRGTLRARNQNQTLAAGTVNLLSFGLLPQHKLDLMTAKTVQPI